MADGQATEGARARVALPHRSRRLQAHAQRDPSARAPHAGPVPILEHHELYGYPAGRFDATVAADLGPG